MIINTTSENYSELVNIGVKLNINDADEVIRVLIAKYKE